VHDQKEKLRPSKGKRGGKLGLPKIDPTNGENEQGEKHAKPRVGRYDQ